MTTKTRRRKGIENVKTLLCILVLFAVTLVSADELPSFKVKIDHPCGHIYDVLKVDDGWLIAIYAGEFGGSLWWYSTDGSNSYALAKGHFQEFVKKEGRISTFGGLWHMDFTRGEMWSVFRRDAEDKWEASLTKDLEYCYPIHVVNGDGDDFQVTAVVSIMTHYNFLQEITVTQYGLVTSVKSKKFGPEGYEKLAELADEYGKKLEEKIKKYEPLADRSKASVKNGPPSKKLEAFF